MVSSSVVSPSVTPLKSIASMPAGVPGAAGFAGAPATTGTGGATCGRPGSVVGSAATGVCGVAGCNCVAIGGVAVGVGAATDGVGAVGEVAIGCLPPISSGGATGTVSGPADSSPPMATGASTTAGAAGAAVAVAVAVGAVSG